MAALGARACALVAALALCACEPAAARCAFTACGGALVGSWTVKDHCPAPRTACPAATADYSGVVVDGTVSFGAEGAYTLSLRQQGTVIAAVPLSCYPAARDCAGVEAGLRGELAASAGQDGVARVVCSGASVCTCRETLTPGPVIEAGSYLTSGNRVILTSGGDATTQDYCVAGHELRLRSADDHVLVLTR